MEDVPAVVTDELAALFAEVEALNERPIGRVVRADP
jgi:hypothetical protein